MADEASKKEGSITLFGANESVRKADTAALVLNGTESYPDDTFEGLYAGGALGSSVAIIEPTFKPGTLYALTTNNNILLQCVEAMEVNIDGTGHSIDLIDGQAENEAEKQILTDFFADPFPGKSLISIRRGMRRDLEATGNGYLEVIRNAADEVVLVNWLDCNYVRLLRLDDPTLAKRTIRRAGKELEVTIRVRERRFIQNLVGKKVYFKEFGASRDVNRSTGEWATEGTRLPVEDRASEVLHFIVNKEPKTAYGTPRWINQLPSVLGSRKAEEHNLEFFDAGGVPPMLIIIQGGALGTGVKEALQAHMSAKGNKHRAAIVEAVSTSGSLDSSGSVQVRVERFGSERQADAMFQLYDKNTEDHVRVSFRLPPLFIGRAGDYTFATAYTAYMIAEAQVFWPEREDFDTVLNSTIVKALGVKSYRFRSLPMTLTDVGNQLKAIEMCVGTMAAGEEIVKKLNEITGLGIEFSKQEPPAPPPGAFGGPGPIPQDSGKAGAPLTGLGIGAGVDSGVGISKMEASAYLKDLALRFCEGLDSSGITVASADQVAIHKEVSALSQPEYAAFSSLLAANSIEMVWADQAGLEELCSCAVHAGA